MSANLRVPTRTIQEAVKGGEIEILDALAISWQDGNPRITCPYPSHEDTNPSWRWDDTKARAFCSCIQGSHSIFDVIMAKEVIDFEAAKVRAAELIGREDLATPCTSEQQVYLAADEASLLNAPADQRDDELPRTYLAHRMSVPIEDVMMPSTPVVGVKALPYYDPPPQGSKARPKPVGAFPCAVFGTVSADGRTHAHRIYLAEGGTGKAELASGPDGHPRDPKKSAIVADGISRAGCAVVWGDPASADRLFLTEGIETGAAVARAFWFEITVGSLAVAAAISATGLEKFQLYPATEQVTVCADRDEADKPSGKPGSRTGEKAARQFSLQNYERVTVKIALPGDSGETVDWLDVLRRDGIDAVPAGITDGAVFSPTDEELEGCRVEQALASDLRKVEEDYPLPKMDTLRLQYGRTRAGEVKVHKLVPRPGQQPLPIPVASPFGVPARLRRADQQDAYGLRVVVQDMDGEPRDIWKAAWKSDPALGVISVE